jgi:hypothetical protein
MMIPGNFILSNNKSQPVLMKIGVSSVLSRDQESNLTFQAQVRFAEVVFIKMI